MKKTKNNSVPRDCKEQQQNFNYKIAHMSDGKEKLDLLLKFQDVFMPLILAYDF